MLIYVFLANGFEEIEAIAPIDIFRRAGLSVTTVSVSGNIMVKGAHGIGVEADVLFEEINFSDECLLFLPGGSVGMENLNSHQELRKLLLEKYNSDDAKLAAICAAPSVFGSLGLLKGREAICYPGFETRLDGAILSENKTVKSGNIYTAKSAGVAIQFALLIVADLKGKDVADNISKGIYLD